MKTIVFVACATLLFSAMCSAANNTVSVAINAVAVLHPGDGSPIPTCLPSKPCNDDDQLRKSPAPLMIAGDGSPIPTCLPSKPCNDEDQLGKPPKLGIMDSANSTTPGLMRSAA